MNGMFALFEMANAVCCAIVTSQKVNQTSSEHKNQMYLIAPSSEHNNLTILFAVADEISKKWIKFGVGGTSKEISIAVKALSSAGIKYYLELLFY